MWQEGPAGSSRLLPALLLHQGLTSCQAERRAPEPSAVKVLRVESHEQEGEKQGPRSAC